MKHTVYNYHCVPADALRNPDTLVRPTEVHEKRVVNYVNLRVTIVAAERPSKFESVGVHLVATVLYEDLLTRTIDYFFNLDVTII